MMKTKEIEQLANAFSKDYIKTTNNSILQSSFKLEVGYIKGYTQCQEDNSDKKYTEEDIRKAINVGISAEAGDYPDGWSFKLGISLEDYFINSLNKQD